MKQQKENVKKQLRNLRATHGQIQRHKYYTGDTLCSPLCSQVRPAEVVRIPRLIESNKRWSLTSVLFRPPGAPFYNLVRFLSFSASACPFYLLSRSNTLRA